MAHGRQEIGFDLGGFQRRILGRPRILESLLLLVNKQDVLLCCPVKFSEELRVVNRDGCLCYEVTSVMIRCDQFGQGFQIDAR